MNIRKLSLALLALLTLWGAGVVRAHDNDHKPHRDGIPVRLANGAPLNFRLIQVSAFNPSIAVSNAGTDQLAKDANNHVAVLNNRRVQIEFHPVVAQPPSPLTYRIWFCRFGAIVAPDTLGAGCVALLDPASTATPKPPLVLTVDASGAAKGVAAFPPLAANTPAGSDVWAGSFVITRAVGTVAAVIEFVSAFDLPSTPDQQQKPVQAVKGAEVELKGEIFRLNGATKSFRIAGVGVFVEVVVDESTHFIGRYKSLKELSNGQEVEVHGTFESDPTTHTLFVVADRIKAGRED